MASEIFFFASNRLMETSVTWSDLAVAIFLIAFLTEKVVPSAPRSSTPFLALAAEYRDKSMPG
ncbi:hypothetical protein CBOM_07084 [Ceraceosorus bombacis]|uniref:Uncharacterized protein n=1 Tax=Ceraceosorus bombacis TaxID=401625 RepID=A0A0P1A4G5_9BASI|nr:hypothetical protein CBOM_07084 [Ceraceosorus bombacis]